MFSGYVLLQQTVPWLAIVSSALLALAPWSTIKHIRTARSTLQYTFLPYCLFTLQSFVFLLYAYLTANLLVTTTACFDLMLGMYYVIMYHHFTSNKRQARRLLSVVGVIGLILMIEIWIGTLDEAQFVIGMAGNVIMILNAASPLAKVDVVMRTRDSSCLPLGLSSMNAFAGAIWALYGLMLNDFVVFFPNLVSFACGMVQLSLIAMYPPPKIVVKEDSHVLHKVNNQTPHLV